MDAVDQAAPYHDGVIDRIDAGLGVVAAALGSTVGK